MANRAIVTSGDKMAIAQPPNGMHVIVVSVDVGDQRQRASVPKANDVVAAGGRYDVAVGRDGNIEEPVLVSGDGAIGGCSKKVQLL